MDEKPLRELAVAEGGHQHLDDLGEHAGERMRVGDGREQGARLRGDLEAAQELVHAERRRGGIEKKRGEEARARARGSIGIGSSSLEKYPGGAEARAEDRAMELGLRKQREEEREQPGAALAHQLGAASEGEELDQHVAARDREIFDEDEVAQRDEHSHRGMKWRVAYEKPDGRAGEHTVDHRERAGVNGDLLDPIDQQIPEQRVRFRLQILPELGKRRARPDQCPRLQLVAPGGVEAQIRDCNQHREAEDDEREPRALAARCRAPCAHRGAVGSVILRLEHTTSPNRWRTRPVAKPSPQIK